MKQCKACQKSGSNYIELPSDYWENPNRNKSFVCFCVFCRKRCCNHSVKLWEMHRLAAEKGQYWWLWPSEKHEIFQPNSVRRHCVFDHNKKEKLWPITVGFARQGIARASTLNADPPVHVLSKSRWEFDEHNYWEFGEEFWHREDQLNLIYMSCTECKLYLGSTEEDYADILGEMCLKCFREQTEQTDAWYDIPPVLKGKQCVVCSINFFGRSDSDKCQKHRECKACGLPFHTHTWQQRMVCGNVIFDPDWEIKKKAEEDGA